MKAKRSILDRVAGWFGYTKRQNYLYDGAQVNRVTMDWISTILSSDQEIRGSIRLLRARLRALP